MKRAIIEKCLIKYHRKSYVYSARPRPYVLILLLDDVYKKGMYFQYFVFIRGTNVSVDESQQPSSTLICTLYDEDCCNCEAC